MIIWMIIWFQISDIIKTPEELYRVFEVPKSADRQFCPAPSISYPNLNPYNGYLQSQDTDHVCTTIPSHQIYPIRKMVTCFETGFGMLSGFGPYGFQFGGLRGRNIYRGILVSFQTPLPTRTLSGGWHYVHMGFYQHWASSEVTN